MPERLYPDYAAPNVDNCMRLCIRGIAGETAERIMHFATTHNCPGPFSAEFVTSESESFLDGFDRVLKCGVVARDEGIEDVTSETTSPLDGSELAGMRVRSQEELRGN